MLSFEGDRDIALPVDQAWSKLTDPRFLVRCIPDIESVKSAEAHRAELVLRPGFSFVRGTLDVILLIGDKTASTNAQVSLLSKGIGSSSKVEATLTLTAQQPGTRVHWTAEVKELGGLLKMVPSGLIRGAAQKVIEDAWTAIVAKLTPSPTPPA